MARKKSFKVSVTGYAIRQAIWTIEVTVEAKTEEEAVELAKRLVLDYVPKSEEVDPNYIPDMAGPEGTIIRR